MDPVTVERRTAHTWSGIRMRRLQALCALLAGAATAIVYGPNGAVDSGSADNWFYGGGYSFFSINNSDSVVFRFTSSHTLNAAPSCSPTGVQLASPGPYTFDPQTYNNGELATAGGSVTFICSVPTHCTSGGMVRWNSDMLLLTHSIIHRLSLFKSSPGWLQVLPRHLLASPMHQLHALPHRLDPKL